MTALRRMLVTLLAIALTLSIAACGSVKGARDVDTDDGEGGMGKGPGLLTGGIRLPARAVAEARRRNPSPVERCAPMVPARAVSKR